MATRVPVPGRSLPFDIGPPNPPGARRTARRSSLSPASTRRRRSSWDRWHPIGAWSARRPLPDGGTSLDRDGSCQRVATSCGLGARRTPGGAGRRCDGGAAPDARDRRRGHRTSSRGWRMDGPGIRTRGPGRRHRPPACGRRHGTGPGGGRRGRRRPPGLVHDPDRRAGGRRARARGWLRRECGPDGTAGELNLAQAVTDGLKVVVPAIGDPVRGERRDATGRCRTGPST